MNSKSLLIRRILLFSMCDIIMLMFSIILFVTSLNGKGSLEGLMDLLSIPIAFFSALGGCSAARYVWFLNSFCKDEEDYQKFVQTLKIRRYVEVPTVLGIISSCFFILLAVVENPLH